MQQGPVWLAVTMLLLVALSGSTAKAEEIPVIDVMVVAPRGFESDVSAARLIGDASKIYESNGLLSLRFAGLIRVHPIPELLSGDLGAILRGRTPATKELRRNVERERLCRRADLVLIWVSTSDSARVAGRGSTLPFERRAPANGRPPTNQIPEEWTLLLDTASLAQHQDELASLCEAVGRSWNRREANQTGYRMHGVK